MVDINKLVNELSPDFKLKTSSDLENKVITNEAEVIFNLPLLTLIVLISSSRLKLKFAVEDISYWVSRVMVELYPTFIYSEQRLRLSSSLRKRSVDALLFLESSDFLEVKEVDGKRVINLTSRGSKFLQKYRYEMGDISRVVGRVEAAVDRVDIKGNELL